MKQQNTHTGRGFSKHKDIAVGGTAGRHSCLLHVLAKREGAADQEARCLLHAARIAPALDKTLELVSCQTALEIGVQCGSNVRRGVGQGEFHCEPRVLNLSQLISQQNVICLFVEEERVSMEKKEKDTMQRHATFSAIL